MIFDLFHSVSDPVVGGISLGPRRVCEQFLRQAKLAEAMGFDTLWLAESHFSSEVQKKTKVATIPQFRGEVGINSDSFQWFHTLARETTRINLGTGIHNIVGGSGGPIASADRVNTLRFINQNFWHPARTLRIGVAAGRFPYQNAPFSGLARNRTEEDFWFALKRVIFLEALEIFLRLVKGETLSSNVLEKYAVTHEEAEKQWGPKLEEMKRKYAFPFPLPQRWAFEPLQLVPRVENDQHLRVVLGSADPWAVEVGTKHWDIDLFNLSFTPPAEIDRLHEKMSALAKAQARVWTRDRLPRTVLVFIDPDRKKARALADFVLDTYIEAMRGTAAVPDKQVLLERALIGDAAEIRDQLSPENPRRFHAQDRLMLWFEFNQLDGEQVERQMRYFHESVVGRL
jgi:alkanesulfonate monooxygenase SsuD/methylene tetrahydromethanopterin reductase-like flavin-dependent oxidoreductase (luciferase family)